MVWPEGSLNQQPEARDFRHGTSEIERGQADTERLVLGSIGGKRDLGWLDAQTLVEVSGSETGNDQDEKKRREPHRTLHRKSSPALNSVP